MKSGEITMLQGTSDFFQGQAELDYEAKLESLKDKIRELFNLKNVNFLFGSGTSSGAIPTMAELYKNLQFGVGEEDLKAEFDSISKNSGESLENCLNVMYSAITYYSGLSGQDEDRQHNVDYNLRLYENLIRKVQDHIFKSINVSFDDESHQKVLGYYKTFYQKLALRNKDNSRIRVFTTNNDLFNDSSFASKLASIKK